MPRPGKRRAPVQSDGEEEATPAAPLQTREPASAEASDYRVDDETEQDVNTSATEQQMVKSLVRLALASEYSRTPLRRSDISQKVLSEHPRQFNRIFASAQLTLRHVFGMELEELQAREKVTIRQRMAAQKTQASQGTTVTNKSWILKSVLPAKFKTPAILSPPKAPTEELESAYIAFYTFVITLILLSGGSLPEAKLERHLRRTNSDTSTPVDKTDKVLARMAREGYIMKIRDNSSGEETIEYMVGPRGKAEVGEKGVAGLVRAVYGPQEDDELEKKIERSLKISAIRVQPIQTATEGATLPAGTPRPRGRPRRNPATGGGNGGADDDDEYSD